MSNPIIKIENDLSYDDLSYDINKFVEKIIIEVVNKVDDELLKTIQEVAKENGIKDVYVIDKTALLETFRKAGNYDDLYTEANQNAVNYSVNEQYKNKIISDLKQENQILSERLELILSGKIDVIKELEEKYTRDVNSLQEHIKYLEGLNSALAKSVDSFENECDTLKAAFKCLKFHEVLVYNWVYKEHIKAIEFDGVYKEDDYDKIQAALEVIENGNNDVGN